MNKINVAVDQSFWEKEKATISIFQEIMKISGLSKIYMLPPKTTTYKVALNHMGIEIDVDTVFMKEINIPLGNCVVTFVGNLHTKSGTLFVVEQ